MKKLSLLAASVALALTGCGGSDGGSSTTTPPAAGGIIITGFDGYFEKAVVFDDKNNNGVLDISSDVIFGLTNTNGQITLPANTKIQGSLALQTLTPGSVTPELAESLASASPSTTDSAADFIDTYTTDMDYPGQPMAHSVVFRTLAGEQIISPLTDLVAIEVGDLSGLNDEEKAAKITDAKEVVNVALGITGNQAFEDVIANGDKELHKTAQILTESKAQNPAAYEDKATAIAAVAKDTVDAMDEATLEDNTTKPVIDPTKPVGELESVINTLLVINTDKRDAIQKQLDDSKLKELGSLEIPISIDLFDNENPLFTDHEQDLGVVITLKPVQPNDTGINVTLTNNKLTLSSLQPLKPGQFSIILQASDIASDDIVVATVSIPFTVKVAPNNVAPEINQPTSDALQATIAKWVLKQGETATDLSLPLAGLFSDANGDTLTYSVDVSSIKGLSAIIEANTVVISGSPVLSYAANQPLTITANDGRQRAVKIATFALPEVAKGDLKVIAAEKITLQAEIDNWTLQVGIEVNETLAIQPLFETSISGTIEYFANYTQHDRQLKNAIPGVTVTVDEQGVVTLSGTPTSATIGGKLYVAAGINPDSENGIESDMVEFNLPNVQPADEILPPVPAELAFKPKHFTGGEWKMGSLNNGDVEVTYASLRNLGGELQFCMGASKGTAGYSINLSKESGDTFDYRFQELDANKGSYLDVARCDAVTIENGKIDMGGDYLEMIYANSDYSQLIVKMGGNGVTDAETFWLDSTNTPFDQNLEITTKSGTTDYVLMDDNGSGIIEGEAGILEFMLTQHVYTSTKTSDVIESGSFTMTAIPDAFGSMYGTYTVETSGDDYGMFIVEKDGDKANHRRQYLVRDFGSVQIYIDEKEGNSGEVQHGDAKFLLVSADESLIQGIYDKVDTNKTPSID